jgi:hypothetical protein
VNPRPVPSDPRAVVLRALHVTYGRAGKPVHRDEIAEHVEMKSVAPFLFALRNERLARPVRKKPEMWLPWDGDDVSLRVALEILRGLPDGESTLRLEPEVDAA